jgi:hypothetical protein
MALANGRAGVLCKTAHAYTRFVCHDECSQPTRSTVMEPLMSSARGDTKPCTNATCSGTMQFGRAPTGEGHFLMSTDGEPGWVCNEQPGHFELDRERPARPASAAPDASWDDDGGSA